MSKNKTDIQIRLEQQQAVKLMSTIADNEQGLPVHLTIGRINGGHISLPILVDGAPSLHVLHLSANGAWWIETSLPVMEGS